MAEHPLIEAARGGELGTLERELARVRVRDTASLAAGCSPILEALYRGHRHLVERLQGEWKLDLREAAALGDVKRLREIVDSGAADLGEGGGDGWTPLHLAAFMGRVEAVECLLEAGAGVSTLSANTTANSALHAALAGAESKPVVEALLRHGADVRLRAGGGVVPIHLAAARGSDDLVDRLLEAGADSTALTDDGKSAADFAAERGHPELAERLRGMAAR